MELSLLYITWEKGKEISPKVKKFAEENGIDLVEERKPPLKESDYEDWEWDYETDAVDWNNVITWGFYIWQGWELWNEYQSINTDPGLTGAQKKMRIHRLFSNKAASSGGFALGNYLGGIFCPSLFTL